MRADMALMFLKASMTEKESDHYRPILKNIRHKALLAHKQRSWFRLLDR